MVQDRVSTGLKVASARDDGAVWAIAQGQRATSRALDTVVESLQRGRSIVEVALAAGESIADLLVRMKATALTAADTTIDKAARRRLSDDYTTMETEIATLVDSAGFSGVNLLGIGLGGRRATNFVAALANEKGSEIIRVEGELLALNDLFSAHRGHVGFEEVSEAEDAVRRVDQAIVGFSASLARLGTGAKALETHLGFVLRLRTTVDAGIGNLVDADLGRESARLQALRTRRDLGAQALSIANGSTASVLQLFR